MSIPAWLRQSARSLFDLLLPPTCPLCLAPIPPGPFDTFCANCQQQILPLSAAACRRCAHPYPADVADDHLCASCLAEDPPLFERVIVGGLFEGALQEAIHRFKYRGQINLDLPLADLLLTELRHHPMSFDLILPVPLHTRRLRQRTYNQSLLIARQIARHYRVPCPPQLLQRTIDTVAQQGLSAEQRRKNLRRAFTASAAVAGKNILLIDDVMTTGATARECSRALRKAGTAIITVAVLARARAF